ncbi:MAG: hypothetical protein JSW53_01425 [Candidatus Bathyarchaeota archaeon]|nr:MAG: hypothetical protein JSW53_01425 [Candidatus Bathyarchaeota archaeon]
MVNEEDSKPLLKKIILNATRAALKGFIMLLLTYLLPTLIIGALASPDMPFEMPLEYTPLVYIFSAIVVFFTVVTELFSGTILRYAFSVGRALVLMMFFIYALNGGILTSTIQIPGQQLAIQILANLKALLAVLILLNVLGLAKSMLEATNFLARKVETT